MHGQNQAASNSSPFSDPLLQIQFESKEDITKMETGLKLAERIYRSQTAQSDNLNFFKARAARWQDLIRWAMGKQDMSIFLDYMNVSSGLGNKAYVNMDLTPTMVGPQFVNTLVESMAKNEEYPSVTAIDDGSMSEKEEKRMDALFRMHDSETVNQLQEEAGMMLEPPDAYVPDNPLAAEVYFKLEDRLPKEINMEQKLESALIRNQYKRILKPKGLFDLVVNNIEAVKLESDGKGGYYFRKGMPLNMFYNYFQGESGEKELAYIGETYSLKVRDARKKCPQLTEEDLFKLAKDSTQLNIGNNFTWSWRPEFMMYNFDRPWDDYNVIVFDFEIKIEVPEYSVSRIDSFGKENITPKKSRPQPQSEKSEIKRKDKTRWYRGIYAPFSNKMLYWGLPDLVIFPYLDTECGLSSWSINIPFNQGEYVPSLFERAMEPLKEYALTKLKRKQLISKLRPTGIRIDIESARNIDLGNGDSIPWEEVIKIYDQTGNELYSSRGVNPNEREGPAISQTAADDTINKILQLTNVLATLIQEIRGLLGVPNYRDGSDVGDRTAAKLAEMQNTSSYNVTDYIQNAHLQVWEEVLYKACLVEWQMEIKKGGAESDELLETTFQIAVNMKPTEYQKQILNSRIEIWSKTPDKNGDPLLSPKDVFYIENIKDFKLANLYLANVIETNRKRHMEESLALQEKNGQIQQQSIEAKAKADQDAAEQKQQMDLQLKQAESTSKKQEVLLTGFMDILKAGMPIPPQLVPLMNATFQNVGVPLVAENEEMQKQLQQKMQMEQEQAEQQAQISQMAEANGISEEEVVAQLQQQEQQQQVA